MPNVVDLELAPPRDPRGIITCGRMVNGRPKSLDHWDISAFPELVALYGATPKELFFYLPGTIDETTSSEYSSWGLNKKKKRQCDGAHCTHRIAERIAETVHCEAGEITECLCKSLDIPKGHKDRCGFSGVLSVVMAHPSTYRIISPTVYRIGGHSKTSYQRFMSVVAHIVRFYGEDALPGMLYGLSIHMASKADDANRVFPTWRARHIVVDTTPRITEPTPDPVPILPPNTSPPAAPSPAAPPHEPTLDELSRGVELRVINTPAPGAPIIPEHEMELYDRAGRTLYGEAWAQKRQLYIGNRTDCQAATRSMEVVIAKREAKITDKEWEKILKQNCIPDSKLPPVIGNSLLSNLLMDIRMTRKKREHNERMDEYDAERNRKWRGTG